MGLLRLGHQRQYSFCLLLLSSVLLEPSHHEVGNPAKSSERLTCRGTVVSLSSTATMVAMGVNHLGSRSFSPSEVSPPMWRAAEASWECCNQPTLQIWEQTRRWWLFQTIKFWGGLLYNDRQQIHSVWFSFPIFCLGLFALTFRRKIGLHFLFFPLSLLSAFYIKLYNSLNMFFPLVSESIWVSLKLFFLSCLIKKRIN